jgi:hypothetical protein
MQEPTYSIKRPNMRIMGTEGGEYVQAKGIPNIFNEIITENFPNLSFKMDGAIKVFHNKQKLKQYMTTKPSL